VPLVCSGGYASFQRALRWRTGCEGRISVLKHGLARCRYHGIEGMQRGVIADNLWVLGRASPPATR
jgi:hypothetical protein